MTIFVLQHLCALYFLRKPIGIFCDFSQVKAKDAELAEVPFVVLKNLHLLGFGKVENLLTLEGY